MNKELAGAALALLACCAVQAQQVDTVYTEQGKLIRAGEAVGTLGNDLFGDKVNLYTGTLEFIQTDVSLPGNSALPVAVGRRLATGGESTTERVEAAFGDWELEIPHMQGVYASISGWQTQDGHNARCTGFGPAPQVGGTAGPSTWLGPEYWHGHHIHVPGAGAQEVLRRDSSNPNVPSDGNAWPLVTKNLWSIRCLPSLARGTGEGFLAVSPDGTQYRFDWMVSRPYPAARKGSRDPDPIAGTNGGTKSSAASGGPSTNIYGGGGGSAGLLKRVEVWILPTVVTDRHGSTVTYTYNSAEPWKVQTIQSVESSGSVRRLTFSYFGSGNPYIQSVTDGSRTWTYSYRNATGGTVLDRVTQSDGSYWQFNAEQLSSGTSLYAGYPSCETEGDLNSTPVSGTMRHPSGAIGSFSIASTSHGKSFVNRFCMSEDGVFEARAYDPRFFAHKSLVAKTLSGPGLPASTWSYAYSPATESSSWSDCTGNCPDTKSVSVTDPRGIVTRYVFGNRHQVSEGQLVRVDAGWNGSTAARTTVTHYRSPDAGPYPSRAGWSPLPRGNADLASRYTPEDQRTITQQDVAFNWQAGSFDVKARPLDVTRASSLGSRSETTAYYDQPAKWVLGQIRSVVAAGKVPTDNDYDEATGNLMSAYRFGHLEHSFTYNTDGTLLTRTDAANHSTTFSNYKRGLAQNATYADGTGESATINDIGLITSVTDANNFTTTYGYDALGRLNRIHRPEGDTTAWNDTTLTFEPVPYAEVDLPAGHWRQTVDTGNARTVIDFDALWRPRLTKTFDTADEANTAKVTLRQFDIGNRTVFESYPARSIASIDATPAGTTTVYDALGRPTASHAAIELGTSTTTYDYLSGFQKRVTNPRGYASTTAYQAFDEPGETAPIAMSLPENVSVGIARDVFGKPLSITRGGAFAGSGPASVTRGYVYDGNERLCKTIEPEIGATVQAYDAASNVAWRATGLNLPATNDCSYGSVAAASMTTFGYDVRNRLTSTVFGDGSPAISRTYTQDGLLQSVVSGSTQLAYTYNKRRLMTQESLNPGRGWDAIYTFDANGHLSHLSQLSLGLAYSPNALGEATQVGGYASGITYHPNGAVAGYTLGNGVVHTLSQNLRGLPAVNRDAGVLQDAYSYDANGNVAAITDQQEGIASRGMAYDGLDRLTVANSPGVWGNASYGYDALDNLRTSTVGARSSVHNYDASNRLETINTNGVYTGYVYDPQGNVTGRGTQGYYFDQGNRMQAANGVATYGYDGLGRRASATDPAGNTTLYMYSQSGQVLYYERQPNLQAAARYIYLAGKLIAEDGTNGISYKFTDALGSPVATIGNLPAVATYSCPAGWTLTGNTCSQSTSNVIVATVASYTCPAGYTLAGSTCSITTVTTGAAAVTYSCPPGDTVSGTNCITNTSTPATPVYACPGGYTLSGATCTGMQTVSATVDRSCNGHGTLQTYAGSSSGYKCITQNLVVSDYEDSYGECQNIAAGMGLPLVAAPLINNSKIRSCVMGPVVSYACPSGGTLNGAVCTSTVTQAASIGSYTCSAGTVSGSSCLTSSVSGPATPSYSCADGQTLSGTTCSQSSTSSTPGTPVYSCPDGYTLSGASCIQAGSTTTAATASFSCPSGGTLSGATCLDALQRTRYEAYGKTAGGLEPTGLGFTGHVNDAATGLVYMQQRYYDPVAGRFLSTDPVTTNRNSGNSFSRFNYAFNNPYRFTDPDGQHTDPCGAYQCERVSGGTTASERDKRAADRATAAAAGGVLGGTLAGVAASGCTAATGGLCGLGFPTIVVGGIAGGAYLGGTLADTFAWISDLLGAIEKGDVSSLSQSGSDLNVYAKPPENARDPNGSKAPGKPTEEVGFKDPKSGENWVPNPNPGKGGGSHGWQDSTGNVWVPSGQGGRAHGGAHWDVQTPGKGYRNVRPIKP